MSLKLVYGRAKSNKGNLVFSEAVKNNGLIIVPETFTLISEQKLSKLTGTLGLSGPEVLSFQRLAHSLSDYGPLGCESIDPCGKTIALSLISEKLKNELKVLKSSSSHQGFSKELLTLLSEFKRYLVPPSKILEASALTEQKILSSKLHDIGLIYEKYSEFIASGYTDKDDDLQRLCTLLAEKKPLSGRHIYLDRFASFTPTELLVIRELLFQCASLTVTLPCEPKSFEFQFLSSALTGEKLNELAKETGSSVEEIYLQSNYKNPELSHLEKNYFSFESQKYEKETKTISIFTAKSINSEVESAARKIRKLVIGEGIRYSDVTVIVRDTALYSSAVKNIFSSFDIPFTDTESLSSAMHALSIYVTSAIEAVTSSFSRDPLFRYLKSGFSSYEKEDIDKLENYMLASGIHGSALTDDEKWTYRTSIYSDYALSEKETEYFSEIDRIRRDILPPLMNLKGNLSGKISALDFSKAVYAFFEDINLQDKITNLSKKYEKDGRNDESARLISVYNAIISAMDSLIATSGETLLTAKKFNSIFADGISATNMSIIPSSADSVNFINASRAKGLSSPIVFIMGLNDNVFPKVPDKGGILSLSDRLFLKDLNIELSPDTEHLNFEELALLYSALTAAEDRLFLSYALHDESGKSITPSSVTEKIREIFPKMAEESDLLSLSAKELISAPVPTLTHMLDFLNRKALGEEIDETWLKVYDWFLSNMRELLPKIPNSLYIMRQTASLSKEITDLVFPDGVSSGVSKLEAYSSCPFKYFMRYILHAEKRKVAEFTPADTGSILHSYVDSVSRYIEANDTSWNKITESEIKEVARSVTEQLIENSSYYVKNSKRALYLIKRLQNLSVKMLTIIKKHFEMGCFEPLGSEIVFGKNGDYPEIRLKTKSGTVNLTGKIDRADILKTSRGDFLRIVDYKSGSKSFSLSEIYHGLNLQLSIYMLALNENTKTKPAAMLYFKLDDPVDKADISVLHEEYEKNVEMKGLLLDDPEILDAMDSSVMGKSEILPFSKKEVKDGFSYTGSLATLENFDTLFSHVKKTVGNIFAEMKAGNVSISPKAVSQISPCLYCDYKAVCANTGECSILSKLDSKNPWQEFTNALHSEDGGDNI